MKRTVLESCICTLSHSSAWVRACARAHTLPTSLCLEEDYCMDQCHS